MSGQRTERLETASHPGSSSEASWVWSREACEGAARQAQTAMLLGRPIPVVVDREGRWVGHVVSIECDEVGANVTMSVDEVPEGMRFGPTFGDVRSEVDAVLGRRTVREVRLFEVLIFDREDL